MASCSVSPLALVPCLVCERDFSLHVPTLHDLTFYPYTAQWKSFLDATGQLWASGALAGKFAGIFFSTASQHG